MKQGKNFKLSYLTSVLMLHLAGAQTAFAYQADENDPTKKDKAEETEVIEISGIRSSLINSKEIKKNASNVVDAITAEDIGKFPDQNVAESLQRISGVAIDRDGGEGQFITVRGMGPEFNSVLFNNRTLATTSGGRAFSFDIFASELISGAEVHKTQSASLQEGAIGATVNITSLSPFDVPGFNAVGSVKALYDDMTEETKPQFSGLISNTFNDDTFGVLASFSASKRESRYDEANTAYYWKADSVAGFEGTEVYLPQNFDQIATTEERERIGGTLVLQYKPNKDMTVTLDALYSDYDVKYRQDVLAHWFTSSNVSDVSVDENNTVEKLSVIDQASDTLVRQSDASNELKAYGFNFDWQVNNDLHLVADIAYSEAESDPGKGWSDTVGGKRNSYHYDRSSGDLLPTMTFDSFNEGDDVYAGWTSLQGTQIEDEVLEAKIDGKYIFELGPLVEMGFGVFYSERTLGSTYAETAWPLPVLYGDNSNRVLLPAELLSTYDADGFLSEGSGDPVQSWPTFNSDELFAWLLTDEAINQLDDPEAARALFEQYNGFSMQDDPTAYEVTEELKAIYADFYFEGEMGDMLWSAVAGIRYVQTDTESKGQQIWLEDLLVSADDPTQVYAVNSDDYLPVKVTHDYDDVLPTFNAKLEITEDVIARFGYSQSLTRPNLNNLSPLSSYGGGDIENLFGSGSNPKLAPYESDNLDLTFEWYYEEGSYAAISGFKKDVDGYIGTTEFEETVTVPSGTYDYTMSRPDNVNTTKIDGYEIAVQHMFTNLPAPFDGLGVIANMTFTDSDSSEDESGQKLPLLGLGDSQNFILFYEKDAVQFRVAYNNRDRFMESEPRTWRDAHYIDDYKQIDVSASYDINENFTVFFEGINVTNELYIKNAELKNQTLTVTETGARYSFGVRGQF